MEATIKAVPRKSEVIVRLANGAVVHIHAGEVSAWIPGGERVFLHTADIAGVYSVAQAVEAAMSYVPAIEVLTDAPRHDAEVHVDAD